MLLALLDGIEKGWITGNHIYLTPELVAAFRENWALLVDMPHRPEFTLPFFHLQGEGFWQVLRYDGQPLQDFTKSLARLQALVDYAVLDEQLFALILEPVSRNVIRMALLDKYFPTTKAAYLQRKNPGGYLSQMENGLLYEPAVAYAAGAAEADEEEAFVRGGLFKKLVPKVYNYTCCITGMRVISTYDIAMVDACHIVPIGHHGVDHVTNGLSLCPSTAPLTAASSLWTTGTACWCLILSANWRATRTACGNYTVNSWSCRLTGSFTRQRKT